MEQTMKLRFLRLHEDAILPRYATDGSGCLDLFTHHLVQPDGMATLGWAVEVPAGHVMLIFSRSGHGFRYGIRLANCVGVIDSDYRGEVKVLLWSRATNVLSLGLCRGTAVAQALVLPIPRLEPEWADELSETERGAGGFGSTDRKEQ